jgi:hypothetical protein
MSPDDDRADSGQPQSLLNLGKEKASGEKRDGWIK